MMTWGEFKEAVDKQVEDWVKIQWIDISYPLDETSLLIKLQGATQREVTIKDSTH